MSRKVLRRRQVEEITGRSRSAIYRDMALGNFPKPIRIGADTPNGAVGWFADEIEAWLNSRPAAHQGEAA